MQASDLMFDLRTGSLVGANAVGQLLGHMAGSIFGAVVSAGFYKLYTTAYSVPGSLFQIPTAYIWLSAARLAYGSGLPIFARDFSITVGLIFALTTTLKIWYRDSRWKDFVPGGVAFAVGQSYVMIELKYFNTNGCSRDI
jgi:uncharacterized oligopeptide transporter (OPT) family protein